MAEEKKNEETENENPAEGKKSNSMLLIIIIVVLILVILIGAIVAILMMGGDSKAEGKEPEAKEKKEEGKQEEAKQENGKKAAEGEKKLEEVANLFPLETFTVNLLSESGSHYLKATLSLALSGPELTKELEEKKAVLRDVIIKILSSKSVEEVSTLKGKEKVKEQMIEELNGMLKDGSVTGVYFTDFVIQ